MSKKKVLGCLLTGAVVTTAVTATVMKNKAKKTTYKAESIDPITPREMGFYEKYVKRAIDVTCATGAIVVFSPIYLGVAALVRTKLGSPVLFTQIRKKGIIINYYIRIEQQNIPVSEESI